MIKKSAYTVLLGMSGGIDSTVAAILLKNKGYKVVGCTLKMFKTNDKTKTERNIKFLTERLGIEHITLDISKKFNTTVIKYFCNEYVNGRTPFPCAVCNPQIKFKYLYDLVKRKNYKYIATGHYAINKLYNNNYYIHQGLDKNKDQSFFLWGLNRDVLKSIIFPLGNLLKENVREIAIREGFNELENKRESFGICFAGKNYRNFLKELGVQTKPGNFKDNSGNILGKHQGISNYTVGQRRGLAITSNTPLFVSEIRASENEVIISGFSGLNKTKFRIRDYYFICIDEITRGRQFVVKIRYRMQKAICTISIVDSIFADVHLIEPETMVANGQTAVFYNGERVVGGGFIYSSE